MRLMLKSADHLLIGGHRGCASELCGLTPADLNFERRFVNVDHQLLRSTEDGYYNEAPKTESGFRQVPMRAAAYEAFERVLKRRRDGRCIEVDGYKDFLFLNRDGLPTKPCRLQQPVPAHALSFLYQAAPELNIQFHLWYI